MYVFIYLSFCVPLIPFKPINKLLYVHNAHGNHLIIVPFDSLPWIIPTWRLCERLMWEQYCHGLMYVMELCTMIDLQIIYSFLNITFHAF
jgi:hypothetical protein